MTSPENPLKTRMSSPVKSIMKIDLRRPPAPSRPAVGSQGRRSQESGGLSAQRGIADSRSRECSPPQQTKDSSPPPRRKPPCLLTLYPLTTSYPPKGPKPCPRPS